MGVPVGWAICDGTKGTPDLRGRFVLMAQDTIPSVDVPTGSSVHPIGQKGGEETHVLSQVEMPNHNHQYNAGGGVECQGVNGGGRWAIKGDSNGTSSAGGNQPHNNMPPFYTLVYIMKL